MLNNKCNKLQCVYVCVGYSFQITELVRYDNFVVSGAANIKRKKRIHYFSF